MLLSYKTIIQIAIAVNFSLHFVSNQSAENFVIESYEWCKNITDPPVKTFITFKNFIPGNQIIDANLSSRITIGENALLRVLLEIEAKVKPTRWIYLFFLEDDFCRVIRMYVGEFWWEIERSAAVAPKTCPIPRGNYHVVNHRLNFKKLKLQTFPFGRLKLTMETHDKTTKQVLSCSVGVIRNVVS